MSASTDSPVLGGFEQRLLTELRARVAARPAAAEPRCRPTRTRQLPQLPRLGRRLSLPVAAGLVALTTGILTLLPAATPTLAQAFPILSGRTHTLPTRLVRVLRAQWLRRASPHFDLRRAYAFRTAAGTGYVLVDQRDSWLCVLIPGLAPGSAGGRCEHLTLARLGQPPLSVRIGTGGGRQEIVALLARGSSATSQTSGGAARRQRLDRGVLTVLARGPVTITTTAPSGRRTRVTYTP